MAQATISLSAKETEGLRQLRGAVRVLAHRSAKKEIERQIRARGERIAQYSCRDLALLAEQYLNEHQAELIAEAKASVERWAAEGFFGKRVQRALANINTSAQTPNEPKSTTSAVQMLGAK
jgi:hypothetical protein